MKFFKNYFFKWLYHFTKMEKQQFINHLLRRNDIPKNTIKIIEGSYNKFKRWIKEGKYADNHFDRNQDSVLRNFYADNSINFENDLAFFNNELSNFIINTTLENHPKYKHQIFFDKAKELHFQEPFFYHLEVLEDLSTSEFNTTGFFYEQFKIQQNRYFHPSFDKDKTKVILNQKYYEPKVVIQDCWENLNKFNLLSQIKMACELRTRMAIFGDNFKAFSAKQIDYLREQILEFPFDEFPEAHIYLELFQLLDFEKLENFEKFNLSKQLIIKYLKIFPRIEQSLILTYLMNCVGTIYNKGFKIGIDWYYDLAKIGFEAVWTKEIPIESSLLLNIYDLTYKKYPLFAENIITNYTTKLNTQEKFWMQTFFDARIKLKNKQYQKALKLAKSLNHHKNYGLTTRKYILILQCQYELHLTLFNTKPTKHLLDIADIGAIENTIENLKTYIRDSNYFKEPSVNEKKAIKNFILIIQQLVNQINTADEIVKQLNSCQTYSHLWLVEKINSYKRF